MQGSPTQINTVLLGSSVIGPIPLPNLVSASEIRDPLSKARDPHYYERLHIIIQKNLLPRLAITDVSLKAHCRVARSRNSRKSYYELQSGLSLTRANGGPTSKASHDLLNSDLSSLLGAAYFQLAFLKPPIFRSHHLRSNLRVCQ